MLSVSSSFLEVIKATSMSQGTRGRWTRRDVVVQLQGTLSWPPEFCPVFGRSRYGRAHRKAWPVALKEKGCSEGFCVSLFLLFHFPFFTTPKKHQEIGLEIGVLEDWGRDQHFIGEAESQKGVTLAISSSCDYPLPPNLLVREYHALWICKYWEKCNVD